MPTQQPLKISINESHESIKVVYITTTKNKTQQNPVRMVMYSSYVGQTIHRNEPVR